MLPTTVKSERRKKLRKKPLRLIYVELANGNGGMMRDLSEEGFAVRAMMPLRKGDPTTFTFALRDTVRIQGEGKVLWIAESGRVAGVEFTQIASEMKSQIDDWLIEDETTTCPREPAIEPVIAQAATMEELREEIRSTPARGEAPEPVVKEPLPEKVEGATVSDAPPVHTEPRVEISPVELPQPAPAVATEPSAAPATAVGEGLFRKWPKSVEANPPGQTRDPSSTPPTAEPPAAHEANMRKVDELASEEKEETSSLPDISEILIQPHGMPANTAAPAVGYPPVPEIREPAYEGRASWEWFTLGRAVRAMLALTVLVATFVYHRDVGRGLIWLGEAMGGAPNDANLSGVSRDADGDATGLALGPSQPGVGPDAGNASDSAARIRSAPSSFSSTPKGATAPVTPLAGIIPPSSTDVSPESGQSEYLQAVEILRGRDSAASAPQAVRLLWVAVEKGNPNAEVMLADLYWHGQGVVKNCDQTRILLTAAARKGSAEAQKRLQQFQQEGCE